MAAGDGGLSLVFSWDGLRLYYLRTDRRGVASSPLHDVVTIPAGDFVLFESYNAVWTDVGFAVLFVQGLGDEELHLRHFVRAE